MSFSSCKPITITTFQASDLQFIGHLFTIHDLQALPLLPKEKFAWHPVPSLTPKLFTPFAQEALKIFLAF